MTKPNISIENTFIWKTIIYFSNANIKCFKKWYEWQYVELSYAWILVNSWLLQLSSHWWWKLSNKCFADVHMLLKKWLSVTIFVISKIELYKFHFRELAHYKPATFAWRNFNYSLCMGYKICDALQISAYWIYWDIW